MNVISLDEYLSSLEGTIVSINKESDANVSCDKMEYSPDCETQENEAIVEGVGPQSEVVDGRDDRADIHQSVEKARPDFDETKSPGVEFVEDLIRRYFSELQIELTRECREVFASIVPSSVLPKTIEKLQSTIEEIVDVERSRPLIVSGPLEYIEALRRYAPSLMDTAITHFDESSDCVLARHGDTIVKARFDEWKASVLMLLSSGDSVV